MSIQSLVFVHLSDIHFARTAGDVYDVDDDLRNELERDASSLIKRIADGRIDAILVTGDIAYSGRSEEYQIASEWLNKLTNELGCEPENVWVSPGNHDVDRSVISRSPVIQALQASLRGLSSGELDNKLSEFSRDSSARVLFDPIKEFNNFAAKYSCDISAEKPYWETDLPLNDGSIFRLRGLNSTLVSHSGDNNADKRLVLGRSQGALPSYEGVAYATLCHHPPTWLNDADTVGPLLNNRAKIQLFGHKHTQRVERVNECLILTAGAVHPSRAALDWDPRYNCMKVWVDTDNDSRHLVIDVFARRWSENDSRFISDPSPNGNEARRFKLALEPWDSRTVSRRIATDIIEDEQVESEKPKVPEYRSEDRMQPLRKLAYRYFNMPYTQSVEVARKLDLIVESDKDYSGFAFLGRILQRAQERNQLEAVWDFIDEVLGEGAEPNPFRTTQL